MMTKEQSLNEYLKSFLKESREGILAFFFSMIGRFCDFFILFLQKYFFRSRITLGYL